MPRPWEPAWNGSDWEVDFRVRGRRVRRRLGVRDRSSQAIARREAKRIWEGEWERRDAPVDGTPFWQAAKAYVEAGGEARFLPRIVAHFGKSITVESLGPVEIAEAGAAIYPAASPPTARRQAVTPIRAVIRFARGERRQSSVDVPNTRWLTPEEAEKLIRCAGPALPKIAFLLGSGCRTAEMFGLDAKHWFPAARRAFIAETKNGHPRWVSLPQRAVDLMGEMSSVGALLRTPKGLPYKLRDKGGGQMAAAFNKARDLAGLGPDVTPHTLRHTWATWFYAHTERELELKRLGGWRKMEMVERYTHLATPDLAERLHAHGWDFSGTRARFGQAPAATER